MAAESNAWRKRNRQPPIYSAKSIQRRIVEECQATLPQAALVVSPAKKKAPQASTIEAEIKTRATIFIAQV
jgi:hypothetical protein